MTDVWEIIEQDETGLPIQIAIDPDGVPVFLSRAVWEGHILVNHPYALLYKDLILLAISIPSERVTEDENHVQTYTEVPEDRNLSMQWTSRLRVVIEYVYPFERDDQRAGLISSIYLVHGEKKLDG